MAQSSALRRLTDGSVWPAAPAHEPKNVSAGDLEVVGEIAVPFSVARATLGAYIGEMGNVAVSVEGEVCSRLTRIGPLGNWVGLEWGSWCPGVSGDVRSRLVFVFRLFAQ